VDGLKTGYIDEAGYNIALTAKRNDTRFIAVILGAPRGSGGARTRDRDAEKLLTWAFANFKTVRPEIPQIKPVKLWKGRDKQAALRLSEPLSFTAPLDRAASLRYAVIVNEPLVAPLPASYPSGWLILADDAGELRRIRLLTATEYGQGNIFRRIWDGIKLFFLRNKTKAL